MNYKFYAWIIFLSILAIGGWIAYSIQLHYGLTVTGMGKEVSWGLYIANFVFLVGIAASAVIVVLPAYIYNKGDFKNIALIGELVAITAILMCFLFVIVDLGRPERILYVIRYPSTKSVMFFDFVALSGYLLLNVLAVTGYLLENNKWAKIFIFLSIPWAISIHTVTAFVFSGLIARSFWNTAILAPRFLASAFASGPALLVMVSLIINRYTKVEINKDAILKLAEIVTYAMIVNFFMISVETFTVFYGGISEEIKHFVYMFLGLDEFNTLVTLTWLSFLTGIISVLILLNPGTRKKEVTLFLACLLLLVSIWIEKGLILVIPAYVPSTIGTIEEYWPTHVEIFVTFGIWSTGFLFLSLILKKILKIIEVHSKFEES
jgi:molybdopterin-containing oxidoreductase family membrane subunit